MNLRLRQLEFPLGMASRRVALSLTEQCTVQMYSTIYTAMYNTMYSTVYKTMRSTVYNAMYSTVYNTMQTHCRMQCTVHRRSVWVTYVNWGWIYWVWGEEQQSWLPVHLSRPLVKDLLDRQATPPHRIPSLSFYFYWGSSAVWVLCLSVCVWSTECLNNYVIIFLHFWFYNQIFV